MAVKIVTPGQLQRIDTDLRRFAGIRQNWFRGWSIQYEAPGRRSSAVVAFSTDGPAYTLPDGTEFQPKAGDVLYLPICARYSFRFEGDAGLSFLAVFHLLNSEGEELALCRAPRLFRAPGGPLPTLLERFCDLAQGSAENTLLLRAMLYEILHELVRLYRSEEADELLPALEAIHRNLCSPPSVPELARLCSVSERTLRRAFLRATGLSPLRYVRRERLEKARLLLRDGELSVADAAEAVGFYDAAAFSHAFRAEYGVSPGSCRGEAPG